MYGANPSRRVVYWERIKMELAVSAPINAGRGRRTGSSGLWHGPRGRAAAGIPGRGQAPTAVSRTGLRDSRRLTAQSGRRAHRG